MATENLQPASFEPKIDLKISRKMVFGSIIFIILAAIGAEYLFSLMNFAEKMDKSSTKSLYVLTVLAVQELILIAPVLYFLAKKSVNLEGLGFKKFKVLRAIKYVTLGFGLFFIINLIIQSIQSYYGIQIPGYAEQGLHIPLFGDDKFSLTIAIIMLVFVAPIVEECLFRGLIYNQLRKYNGFIFSALTSALIFSGFHLEFAVIIPLFILGVIIAWIYEKNDSIWAPIIFHIANNALALAGEIMILNAGY